MALTITPAGLAAALLGTLALAACNQGQQPAPAPSEAPPPETVVRETPPAEAPAPVPAMAPAAALQSQPGPDGSQVDLLKVAVTGDILTVTLRCSSTEKYNTEMFTLKDVSVIDDATSQRIAVLKDNNGDWLASNVRGDYMNADCTVKPGVMWFKFAAPSAGATTVSINLPKVAPFDGIPVTR